MFLMLVSYEFREEEVVPGNDLRDSLTAFSAATTALIGSRLQIPYG